MTTVSVKDHSLAKISGILWAYLPSVMLVAFAATLWTISQIVYSFASDVTNCGSSPRGALCAIGGNMPLVALANILVIGTMILLFAATIVTLALYEHRLKSKKPGSAVNRTATR